MSDNELNQDDLAEWRAIAQRCLDGPTMPASALEAAFLALRKGMTLNWPKIALTGHYGARISKCAITR